MNARELFSHDSITADMFDFLCGDFLGFGISRAVYEYQRDSRFVIKIEYAEYFQNICEFEVWHRIKGTKLSKWFAPCDSISPCGKILIQRKTKETSLDNYPNKIPSFFTDVKYDGWGMLNGNVVCHDYGIHLLMEKGMGAKLKKVKW